MPQSPEKVLKELKAQKYAPVYFLHGEESYYIDLISNYIEKHVLSPSDQGFNQIILYGKETDMATILGQARRFPMMAERQVVIVKELQQMPDWSRSQAQQMLESYLSQPQPSTLLVLSYKHKSHNKNAKIYKALEQQAVVVEAKRLYENQVPAWIQQYLQKKGLQIEENALQLLVEAVGADLARLHTELEKIILNLSDGQSIRAETIEKYVGIHKDYNVFELQKALINKNMQKAHQIIRYWEANPKKQPLIPTLALLGTFFSKVLLAYHQKDRSEQNLARALRVSPYFVRDYKTMMQNYPLHRVIEGIHYLREADLQVKGIQAGGHTEGQILRELLSKIIFG